MNFFFKTSETTNAVFHEVDLHFADFEPHHHQHHHHHAVDTVQTAQDDIKILNTNSIDKCIGFVSQTVVSPLKDLTADEFSDTEDMLEGIRNVVDKVSIEDTCDDNDLMGSNSIRATWFSSNNFTDIAFKSKSFTDVSLAHILETEVDKSAQQQQQPVQANTEVGLSLVENVQLEAALEKNINSYYLRPQTPNKLGLCEEVQPEIKSEILQEDDLDAAYENEDEDFNMADSSDTEGESSEFVENLEHSTNKKTSKKRFICTKCKREFNSGNALKYHHRTHLGVRPHQCDICGKSFFAHSALKSHMRVHTGDKPFECEHCQRKFRQWGDLKYHVVSIHTPEKSYQCEFCGKAFSRKYSLVLHLRIHTSERNYKCEFCAKTFRASTYLMNHRKIHTGEKPHECSVCAKRFRVIGDLRRHMRIHQPKGVSTKGEKNNAKQ